MEEGLRYGIALAKLARFLDANSVRKICEVSFIKKKLIPFSINL